MIDDDIGLDLRQLLRHMKARLTNAEATLAFRKIQEAAFWWSKSLNDPQ